MTSDEFSDGHSHSVTWIIAQLQKQDPHAAGLIWQRFFQRLLPLARARLKALPDHAVDAEDILVSVFDRFFQAAKNDRFAQLQDREDLWQILLMLTDHRVSEQFRRSGAQKRGGGKVIALNDLAEANVTELREMADEEPGPEFLAAFNDNLSRAMARLSDEKTREVALLRLEGFENLEIASQLDIGLSSVERKLRVIREAWQQNFNAD